MTSFDKCFISFLRACVKLVLCACYRLRVLNVDNIPQEGAVLLVGNHFTFLDSLFVYCTSKRSVRFIADVNFLPKKGKLTQYVICKTGVISFVPGNKSSAVKMIRSAQEALQNGEVVCIFPEGGLTRDGQVRAFKQGFLSILKKAPETPIVPFGIVGFFGSRWAYAKPKKNKSRPTYRPCISYGEPFSVAKARESNQSDAQISQRLLHIVQELCVDACDYEKYPENVWLLPPTRAALRGCRTFGNKQIFLADSTGKEISGSRTLLEILVLRRVLHRVLGPEKYVGVILPTSVGAVLANAAIAFGHRIPVNLNYTLTNEVINNCIGKVNVKKVLTSSQLLKKLPKLEIEADLLVLEDLVKTEIRTSDKIIALLQLLLPTYLLERVLGLIKHKLSDTNTVVFTSGSTGVPKGMVLSNLNIAANGQSFIQSAMPEKYEIIYGTLPFFHSFGYTITVWFPLMSSYPCVYHFNPLDYKMVGAISKKYRPTLFISTPTFMRTYLRKCPKEEFEHIEFPVPGAEKTPKELLDGWKEKFGYELNEGYGATELSPVLCHNLPSHRAPDNITPYHVDGSVGRANPNFVAKVIDMETGEEMPPNESGMLVVKGNSVTSGYYEDPENTAKIFKDGWYVTGDVAKIDDNNFIFITGREMRISKIGGEMAPHILIEERLTEAVEILIAEDPARASVAQNDEGDDGYQMVVTAVPDEKKGEKLVVLYTNLPFTPEEICKKINDLELLPSLWAPSAVNFKQIDHIPVLGTGKLDLKGIKKTALEIYGFDRAL